MMSSISLEELLIAPQDREELKTYIKKVFDMDVPDVAVCPGHKSPFDFVADVYFEKVKSVIALANRGGGKTQNFALIDALNCNFKSGCETGTVGAVETQADRCYSYFSQLIQPYKDAGLVASSQRKETRFIDPINSSIRILVGTVSGVNSPHPQKAFFDEFELSTWQIFQEWINMSRTKKGIKAQNIISSTRKHAYGPMERLIRGRKEMGYKLYTWCVFESGKRCTFKNCKECSKIIKGTWKDGSPRTFKQVCKERLRKSNGFIVFEDIIQKFRESDRHVWEAQQECKKPSSEGAVLYWFDKERHVMNFDFNPFDVRNKFWESLDWGGSSTDPNVYQLWMERENSFYCIDELYLYNTAPSVFAKAIIEKRELHQLKRGSICSIEETYCDPSSKISRNELEVAGIPTTGADNSIEEGLRVINSIGSDDHIFVHERCKNTISDFTQYHWPKNRPDSKKPDHANSHACDAARYFFLMRNPLENNTDFRKEYIESKDKTVAEALGIIILDPEKTGRFDWSHNKLFDGESSLPYHLLEGSRVGRGFGIFDSIKEF